MSESNVAEKDTADSTCCPPTEQETCCEPSEKSSCCGAEETTVTGTCGCQ